MAMRGMKRLLNQVWSKNRKCISEILWMKEQVYGSLVSY